MRQRSTTASPSITITKSVKLITEHIHVMPPDMSVAAMSVSHRIYTAALRDAQIELHRSQHSSIRLYRHQRGRGISIRMRVPTPTADAIQNRPPNCLVTQNAFVSPKPPPIVRTLFVLLPRTP